MNTTDCEKRAFVRAEALRLDEFLSASDDWFHPHNPVVGWTRGYKCDCGFSCVAPDELWDHMHHVEAHK